LNKIISIKVLTENKWSYDISLQLTVFKIRSLGLKVVQKGWALTQKKARALFIEWRRLVRSTEGIHVDARVTFFNIKYRGRADLESKRQFRI